MGQPPVENTSQFVGFKNQALNNMQEIPANAPGLHKMQIGKRMMIVSGVMIGLGSILVASSGGTTYYNYSNTNGNTNEEGNLGGAIGALSIAGGIGLFIPGVIIHSKGKKRYKAYLQSGTNVSLRFSANSVGICFNFK